MRVVSLPDVAYGATAVRPDWTDLPAAVRDAVSSRLGGPVTASASAGGGFTRAFAALVTTADGARAFVKAAPLSEPISDWYAREAAITAALPSEVPAARPRWTLQAGGYYVLCLEAVDGHVPNLPWTPADLAAALEAWRVSAEALARPSAELLGLGLPPLGAIVRDELSWWSEIAAGRAPLPPVPDWVPGRLGELAALEQGLPDLVAGPGMLHGDLRVDNVLLDAYGRARLCDWTWPCLGAQWFDTVTLLVTAYASGLDTDAALAPWDPPPDGVDGALAALGGYWLTRAAGGPSSASPHSRQHQRFSGNQALAWLAERRGWAV
ncbi:phosphotransferase family protein [Actinoplanes friuliensis]|uniref:Protein kinase 3 n=1 Tax=Actinoplanes friuliensis DSM 7358 TaxID=1246995 RepID=U5VSQ9_9ACTN|nr:phosphotransferase [Actinoplanes friuliensis]AGZ39847.1 Protein kinase 3 [Actinoplanes friuliensis DSM 7358]